MSKYQNAINQRRESLTNVDRFRGGKLSPMLAQAFRESESGMLSQTLTFELDPIAGRMITPITAEVISVYVPVQAMDAIRAPEADYAGMTEVVREKLLSGNPLFALEAENEITKRLGIVPRSINGQKRVSSVPRLAHNSAVNFLRKKKYVNAAQVDATNTNITPALINQTVLDRLNGVLDPEDRVNGAVEFNMPRMLLPVSGIGRTYAAAAPQYPNLINNKSVQEMNSTEDDEGVQNGVRTYGKSLWTGEEGANMQVHVELDEEGKPNIRAVFEGQGQDISLQDFYNAELMDNLTRQMRDIVDANPEYGEEMVTRWAHGLSVDTGKLPFILYQKEVQLGQRYREATDGASLDVSQTDLATAISFTVPVPATELGGVVLTFAAVKPDETLASQPHPIFSDNWAAINYVSEELARDPVPVTIRELDADCAQVDEGTVAFYVGHNHLKKTYIHYGFSRQLDINDVENKTALWQLEIPMSVTPQSVLYPDTLSHYPFADQLAEVVTCVASHQATINTPMIFGPTPVEELAQIETDDIFEDAE